MCVLLHDTRLYAATLGSAFGIASHDITEKCGILMKRCVPGLYGASRRLWSGYNVASCNECRRAELEETARAEGLGLATPLASGEPPATDGTTGPVRLTLQYMISREVSDAVMHLCLRLTALRADRQKHCQQ
jgi:hypothetical protein